MGVYVLSRLLECFSLSRRIPFAAHLGISLRQAIVSRRGTRNEFYTGFQFPSRPGHITSCQQGLAESHMGGEIPRTQLYCPLGIGKGGLRLVALQIDSG